MSDAPTPDPASPRRVVPLWKQRPFQIGAAAVATVIVAIVISVALSAGGDDDTATDASTDAADVTTASSSSPTTEPGAPPPIAPLTGLADESLVSTIQPALLAKIDNVALARRPDQAGIDIADVVYEEPVEGATRLLAVFQSQVPERIGPIRSTRFIDAGIAWPFGEVPYVYSGGTPPKVAAINESPVQTFDESGLAGVGANQRDPDIAAPHNLFASPAENVWAAANDRTPPAPLFSYLADDDEFIGVDVTAVEFPSFSRATYAWDPDSETWLRFQLRSGSSLEPHRAESGDVIAVTNLIVQRISGTQRDSIVGEGTAWFFVDGQVVVGRWSRAELEAATTFTDTNGVEVALRPGNTWIHLITGGEPTLLDAPPA